MNKNIIIIIIGVLMIGVSASFLIFDKDTLKCSQNLTDSLDIINEDISSGTDVTLTYSDGKVKKSVINIYMTYDDEKQWNEFVTEWDNNQNLISTLFDTKDEPGFKKEVELNKKKKYVVLTETIVFDKATTKVKEENDLDRRYEDVKTKEIAKENYEKVGFDCE